LVFLYVILARYGHQPFSEFWYLFLVALVVISVLLELVIRARSPRTIEIDGSSLNLEWSDGTFSVSVDDVSVRKGLDWLITSGRVLTARGRTFVVFKNLDGYDEFCTAVGV